MFLIVVVFRAPRFLLDSLIMPPTPDVDPIDVTVGRTLYPLPLEITWEPILLHVIAIIGVIFLYLGMTLSKKSE